MAGRHLKKKPIAVFAAPFDVRFPDFSKADEDVFTVLQPDVCVICDASKLDAKGGIGAPDIVVEILLPGNNRKDLKNKFEVYEEAGVSEYWIIDYMAIASREFLGNPKIPTVFLNLLADVTWKS